jgi:hypothetical protein
MSFHEVGSLGAPAAVRLPLCPPTYSAANAPVSWSYSLDISAVQPGLFSNKLMWSYPLVIGPVPAQMLMSTDFYLPFQPGFAPPPAYGGNYTGAKHTGVVLRPPANAMQDPSHPSHPCTQPPALCFASCTRCRRSRR